MCACMGDAPRAIQTILDCTSLHTLQPRSDNIPINLALQFVYIAAPVYQLCNGFTKLSLLCIYLQLSPQRCFRLATWLSIVLVALYTVVIAVIMLFHCSPVRKAFDLRIQTGACLDAGILYMATAVSNILTDVMLFLLPTPMVLRLEMDRAQKMGAIAIFGIASATVATSIVRLVYLPATLRSIDPSWDAAPANVWTYASPPRTHGRKNPLTRTAALSRATCSSFADACQQCAASRDTCARDGSAPTPRSHPRTRRRAPS